MMSQEVKNKMASTDVYSAVKATLSWFFRRLWQDFSWNHIKCKNNDQTYLFQCINICRVPRKKFNIRPSSLMFKQLPRDPANVNAWKNMFEPYIQYWDSVQVCDYNLIMSGIKLYFSRLHLFLVRYSQCSKKALQPPVCFFFSFLLYIYPQMPRLSLDARVNAKWALIDAWTTGQGIGHLPKQALQKQPINQWTYSS